MLLHSCCTTLAKLLQKNNTLTNSTFNFRQRPFWHTKRHIHCILHSRQGPLDRHSCVQAGFRMQNNSNLTTVRISSSILLSKEGSMQEQTTGQASTQDQSLVMLDHCQSSDLMRIVPIHPLAAAHAELLSANMWALIKILSSRNGHS